MAYVISANLHRRQLTGTQKAVLAVELLPMLEAEAKERMRAGGGDKRRRAGPEKTPDPIQNQGESREQAAKLAGTNSQYVGRAKRIKRDAPEVFDDMKAGKISNAVLMNSPIAYPSSMRPARSSRA